MSGCYVFSVYRIDSSWVIVLGKRTHTITILLTFFGFAVLILDTRTAVEGAKNGIALCLHSIIPSLLPFCVLSKVICTHTVGKRLRYLRPINCLLGIPEGTESIFLLSFLSGYPVGSQCIADAYNSHAISRQDAERMLSFCNNAGPAFIFGVLGCLFPNTLAVWSLYIIHIGSAVLVGILMPKKTYKVGSLPVRAPLTLNKALEDSIKTIGIVCTWIILSKTAIQIINKWFLHKLCTFLQVIFVGIFELSNGCIDLMKLDSLSWRYILCALFLSLGGLCITLQTVSVTKGLSKRLYFPGKALQAVFSTTLATLTYPLLFQEKNILPTPLVLSICIILSVTIVLFLKKSKKAVAIA